MQVKKAMKWLWCWLTLLMYGNNLLCNDAATWIFSVRLIMLFLIGTECGSWGYAAWHIAPDKSSLFCCAFAVIAAFTLNWTLDGSIMMIDRDKSFAALRPKRHESRILTAEYKVLLLVSGRLLMISAVLYASSAFLVQALFNNDIANAIANDNRTTIDTKQTELLAPLRKEMGDLNQKIDALDLELPREIQGRLKDHLKGCGPACEELRAERATAQAALKTAQRKEHEIQYAFEHESPSILAEQFHFHLLGSGLQARGQIVDKLKQNDGFRRTERTIQGALLILFAGLLLLKLYQPPSVLIYYSAALQDLYGRYEAGRLNHLLQPHQVPDGKEGGMTPYEFAKWAQDFFLREQSKESERQERAVLDAQYKSDDAGLQEEERVAIAEVEHVETQMNELAEAGISLGNELRQLSATASRMEVAIEDLNAERERLLEAMSQQGFPTGAYESILNRIAALKEHTRQTSAAKEQVTSKAADCDLRRSRNRFDQGRVADLLALSRGRVAYLRDQRAVLQKEYIERITGLRRNNDNWRGRGQVA